MWAVAAQDPAPAPVVQEPAPVEAPAVAAAPQLPNYEIGYHSAPETDLFVNALAFADPEHVRRFEVGAGFDGRVLAALEIAASGPLPANARPTVFLIGGFDGRSLAGSEAVRACARDLAGRVGELRNDLTIIAIPFASPDALERAARGAPADGGDARPVDDDHDGRFDEDGPDDLDEDGLVLRMLIEAPNGPWARSDDPRFLVAAGRDDAPRYVLTFEGMDDDGDGRFNEDGPGGVVLDRNFPLARGGPWSEPRSGALPLSEPLARAVADLVLARRAVTVVLFQGTHGGLAIPGGSPETEAWAGADRALYERCAQWFRAATGRTGAKVLPLREAWGEMREGAALDWFAAVPGALSLEFAPWGPAVDSAPDVAPRNAHFDDAPEPGSRPPCALDRAWALWLDNVHGGLGFVEWRPVALSGGASALVGGFEAWTTENPPQEVLHKALRGSSEFVRELCASVPRLELSASAERDGGIVKVRARVRNTGKLPTSLAAPCAVRDVSGLALALELPEGARVLTGALREPLARLAGGELSRDVEWLVLAPQGARIVVRAQAPWCAGVATELAK